MNVLVLGGTQFVGRHIVEALVEAGHTVSILNRGQTADPLSPKVERIRGDRDLGPAGLEALSGRHWDVCVDVSGYTAPQVRATTELLRARVGLYVFISAVSVYGRPISGPVTEDQPLVAPAAEEVLELNNETYGRLKVTCENLVRQHFPGRNVVLRPQIVAGPHDPVDRFAYWVWRVRQGGEILAPGDGSDYLQYIDARDVARFALLVCERGVSGNYNLAGPRITWKDFLNQLGAQKVCWVPEEVLSTSGLTEQQLPLYRRTGSPRSNLMHVCNRRALAVGLALTPTNHTIDAIAEWLDRRDLVPALSPEREASLIKLARSLSPNERFSRD